MIIVLVIAIFSAIPAWLIFRNQGGVRRGIAALQQGGVTYTDCHANIVHSPARPTP